MHGAAVTNAIAPSYTHDMFVEIDESPGDRTDRITRLNAASVTASRRTARLASRLALMLSKAMPAALLPYCAVVAAAMAVLDFPATAALDCIWSNSAVEMSR